MYAIRSYYVGQGIGHPIFRHNAVQIIKMGQMPLVHVGDIGIDDFRLDTMTNFLVAPQSRVVDPIKAGTDPGGKIEKSLILRSGPGRRSLIIV